jgi:solute carrier family 8 (sodium/calcium exchanger)
MAKRAAALLLLAGGAAAQVCEPKICEPGGEKDNSYFWPRAVPYENDWAKGPRAILYLALLFWTFMGVAIVADIFMEAIEKITSKKRVKVNKETGDSKTVKVWNDTVANLTLMALGSSAPEILLNVIEICAGGFEIGPLGASTIVGSAAFNLLIISAVCIVAIDSSETRHIDDMGVYSITASFSVFAYVWLLLIVVVITPDRVDLWEALATFFMFPLLVVLAYLADVGKLPGFPRKKGGVDLQSLTSQEYASYEMKILQKYGNSLPDDQIAILMEKEYGQKVSRAEYRVRATKAMMGERRVAAPVVVKSNQVVPMSTEETADKTWTATTTLQFAANAFTVMESVGEMELTVNRSGELHGTVKVGYRTIDGTAQSGKDYEAQEGILTFAKGVSQMVIKIPIINDADQEKDEFFDVELTNTTGDDVAKVKAEIGENSKVNIRIVDDDHPGELCFVSSNVKVTEDTAPKIVQIHVERRNGSRGEVSVTYKTEDDSAHAGTDYEEASGTLTFKDGQAEGMIEVVVLPLGRYESAEQFRVMLEEVTGGATLCENTDERDMTTCTIRIECDEQARQRTDRVMKVLQLNWDKNAIGSRNWKEQFTQAFKVNGGGDEDEDEDEGPAEPPSAYDYFIHALAVFWKVIFACIPPPDYCDGWLCFSVALIAIGIVTTLISDLANLVGCCLGMPGEITAITIVALGTSLPDTFASMAAAKNDPHADASVGNVTGSNAVNVFLGLGVPWTLAAIYWEFGANNPAVPYFIVPSGNLAISVATFCGCALCAILILYLRRKIVGGELGGPAPLKFGSAAVLIGLWGVYIVVSSIVVFQNRGPCD